MLTNPAIKAYAAIRPIKDREDAPAKEDTKLSSGLLSRSRPMADKKDGKIEKEPRLRVEDMVTEIRRAREAMKNGR
tara:strand:+ start:782 stop:1009 length:228 start_codon:yes stop_codon:yes gene_type:complete